MAILVDAECVGVESLRIVEGGVDAAVVEEAVIVVVTVRVIPNDLARGVDAFRNSDAGGEWIVKAVGGQGIVEGGVGAAVGIVEEPVGGIADEVSPDDQTRAVDAVRLGAVGGQRIVEGGVGAAVGIVEEPCMPAWSEYLPTTRPAPLMPYA